MGRERGGGAGRKWASEERRRGRRTTPEASPSNASAPAPAPASVAGLSDMAAYGERADDGWKWADGERGLLVRPSVLNE